MIHHTRLAKVSTSQAHIRRQIRWRVSLAVLSACCVFSLPGLAKSKKASPKTVEKAQSGETKGLPSVEAKTQGLERREGFLTFFLDPDQGKIWLEVAPADNPRGLVTEFIYLEGLTTGLGSNPVGLDRGQVSESQFLHLRRLGSKVFVEAPNLRYRAVSDDQAEVKATDESFATSILWAQEIVARDDDGRALVDFTSFLLRDAHGVSRTLRETSQGSFLLDTSRSMVDLAHCLAFPDNVELQAILTWGGSEPGEHVQQTAPVPQQITLVQHYSLVRPPPAGFEQRPFDPRISAYDVRYMDFAVDLDEPVERRSVIRHRLEKTDPTAARSTVVEPIVYYVDGGAPEPVRSALLDGARWWADAFDAAGFIDAFRVEILPPDVHPLDARNNVIQWVHRSTRGWSYGTSLIDPRTGEIIKGHVNLGSLRVRQDRLLFEGLAGVAKTGSGAPDDPIQLALARIRQLAAHEVGHTLGFAHNFAASTYAGRASVMDYPAPWVHLKDGELDFSEAYAVGMGAWDTHAVRFAYSQVPPGVDAEQALEAIVQDGLAKGHVFLTDEDARPETAAEPRANLWDNGSDAVEGLQETLEVRRHALRHFGLDRLAAGQPVAHLEEVLAPIYFYHRYQLDAAVKTLGGMEYNYALVGDGQWTTRRVSAERQRRALEVVLSILEPENLDMPEAVLDVLTPRPFQHLPNRELFSTATWPVFDALGAARSAADQVMVGLLQPERLARVVDFRRRDDSSLSLDEVLQAIDHQVFENSDESARHQTLRQVTQWVFVERLMLLANSWATPEVRSIADWHLAKLRRRLDLDDPHQFSLAGALDRFAERRMTVYAPANKVADELPPGSPIGSSPVGASSASSSQEWSRPLAGASHDVVPWAERGCGMAYDFQTFDPKGR